MHDPCAHAKHLTRRSPGRLIRRGGRSITRQRRRLRGAWVTAAFLSAACVATSARAGPSTGAGTATTDASPAAACGGDPSCTDVNSFAMSVVEFRASLQGNYKILSVTLRFRNKLGRPLTLGYVMGSGGATDDRGNRYLVRDGDIRGIGLIANRNSLDDKFALAPGQTGDARFTLVWGGRELFGNTFDLDLTVREIVPAGNGQSTLGPEYPLQIVGLVDGAHAAAPVAQASGSPPPSSPPTPSSSPGQPAPSGTPPAPGGGPASPLGGLIPGVPAASGHCPAGAGGCYDAGNFTVSVVQTVPTVSGKNHLVRFSVRVKNQTTQPLVLAYKAGTNSAVDDQGNTYGWGGPATHDGSVQAIGMIEGARIDPQFQVGPGATRDASLMVTRNNAGPRITARSFTLNTVLVELRRPPKGQQWQNVREYSIRLPGVGTGIAAATPGQSSPGQGGSPGQTPPGQGGSPGQTPPGQTPQSQNPATDQVQKATDLLRGLMGK
jgi:hypothetical protein